MTACRVSTCDKRAKARGLCGTHYSRWKRNGSPYRDRWHGHWDLLTWFTSEERIMTPDELEAALRQYRELPDHQLIDLEES